MVFASARISIINHFTNAYLVICLAHVRNAQVNPTANYAITLKGFNRNQKMVLASVEVLSIKLITSAFNVLWKAAISVNRPTSANRVLKLTGTSRILMSKENA